MSRKKSIAGDRGDVWRWLCSLALGIILLTCSGWTTAQSGLAGLDEVDDGKVIPFTYDPLVQPHLVIQVRINGYRPLPFVVDTGSPVGVLIDRRAARRLGLHPTRDKITLLPGSITFARTAVRSIELIGTDKTNDLLLDSLAPGYVGDLPFINLAERGRRAAGVIGIPLLSFATVRLDFCARTLTFYRKPNAPLNIPDAFNLPLKERDNGCFDVDISPQSGLKTPVEVDTGSPLTAVPQSLEPQLKPAGVQDLTHFGSDGQRFGHDLLLTAVSIGDCVEPDVEVETTIGTPILGTELLSRFAVILDFRNRMMVLQRARDYQEHLRVHGFAGAGLWQYQNGFYVNVVFTGSAASKAGLQQNDRILSIDHRSLKDLTRQDSPLLLAQRLLDGYAGTQAEVTIERQGGERLTLTFTRQQHFQPDP